jgi:hypothetical protein
MTEKAAATGYFSTSVDGAVFPPLNENAVKLIRRSTI